MDKNSIIGLFIIGAIIIGFGIYNQPSQEQIDAARKYNDSIALVQKEKAVVELATKDETPVEVMKEGIVEMDSASQVIADSIKKAEMNQTYGVFTTSALSEGKDIVVENDVLKLIFATKGGRIKSAELKDYQTYDSLPLVIMDASSRFGLNFFTRNNKNIVTEELNFEVNNEGFVVTGDNEKSITFRLNAGSGKYLEYVYTIKGNDYMIDLDLNMVGLNEVMAPRTSELLLDWKVNTPILEKSRVDQVNKSTLYYKFVDQDVDYISERSDEKENFEADVKWVSLKQQFFNTSLIAKSAFSKYNAYGETETRPDTSKYIKTLSTSLSVPFGGSDIETFGMSIFLGPNKHDLLENYGIGLEQIIDLGWGILGWINEYAVIPVFNALDSTAMSYGIIILILTVLLKLVLFPITYKTYMSGAKMRVLKPEIAEINAKYGDDAMKKQQATMALYRQTGVNPLAGCIPMLIQMPILIAMFKFFPASIELRQESFLWATDLSTYDSILNLGFEIPFYGDHVSLFTILMAISLAFYTKFNSQMGMGATAEGPMAAQMKIMMYLMPVMMLFFFNSYPAGLSYYYFLANVISLLQTLIIQKVFINEDAIRAKLEANKKRPKANKKSKFQQKLEEMAKQQQQLKGKGK
ncbi:membrane protein insertase YidC [Acidiluteibacter ferrifornacis]|uniref:Membrane protein insertase YidC n=1 Tax=Acidiluteibacter ferrifornacis TaxID=2692424 RepID=A0A6N9NNL9_9FLAO|nr:membrane protein insertase YidC [Acidiluteibacter ferrifornacis]NBG66697.1 membrane protein insertase YidC [Acidiluteibacter ferrifornacis]